MTARTPIRQARFFNTIEAAYRKHLNRTFGIIIGLELLVALFVPTLMMPLGAVAGTVSVTALVWLHRRDQRRSEMETWRRWYVTLVSLAAFVTVTFVIPQFV